MKNLVFAMAITMLGACSSSDDDDSGSANSALLTGFQSGATVGNVAETMAALETALNANDLIGIVAQIDHQANADANNLELRPTRVTLFGNPRLGTPLMQINQLAGLDLPQKMFAWTDAEGQSNIAYNSASYLNGRHSLGGAQETLDMIDTALAGLATTAGGQEFVTAEVTAPTNGEGITIEVSANDMDTTFNNLLGALQAAGPITVVTQLDHAQNAESVGLELRPTRLIVFGNPNLGTPLMQSGQSIGIDLPQKMLVFEDADGVVSVAYNEPSYLAERHGVTDQANIDAITQALRNFANVAISAP